jgi:hypothetical protein
MRDDSDMADELDALCQYARTAYERYLSEER